LNALTPTDKFLWLLQRVAGEAVSEGLPMRLLLKSGEILEGVPENVTVDHSNVGPRDMAPHEAEFYGPPEYTVTLSGTSVLAQEVRGVRRAAALSG
jgi:hypothetical protein